MKLLAAKREYGLLKTSKNKLKLLLFNTEDIIAQY